MRVESASAAGRRAWPPRTPTSSSGKVSGKPKRFLARNAGRSSVCMTRSPEPSARLTFLLKPDIGLHGADAVVGEQDHVRMFLQQGRGPGMELDDVAVVGVVLGAVEALDVGVGDLDHRHPPVIAQGVEAIEILPPEGQGSDIAFAETGVFDRSPAVVATGPGPRPAAPASRRCR